MTTTDTATPDARTLADLIDRYAEAQALYANDEGSYEAVIALRLAVEEAMRKLVGPSFRLFRP